jgi:hypothetical protein
MAMGYHCFVQENEPCSLAASGTKSTSALQDFVQLQKHVLIFTEDLEQWNHSKRARKRPVH